MRNIEFHSKKDAEEHKKIDEIDRLSDLLRWFKPRLLINLAQTLDNKVLTSLNGIYTYQLRD